MASASFLITIAIRITLLSISTFPLSLSTFSPIDHYLINCGCLSSVTDPDNRVFAADTHHSDSIILSSTRTSQLKTRKLDPSLSQIYHTARVFRAPSKYLFLIRDKGYHLIRLHFDELRHTAGAGEFFGNPQFHVLADDFVLLSNFSGNSSNRGNWNPRIWEFVIWVDSRKLEISFIPSKRSDVAYVNAIELISAPKDLVPDIAQYVSGTKNEKISGLLKQGLEIMYRINVGGAKVTPFNGSLWRHWVPDDEFLISSYGSEKLYFGGRIKYHTGGASREVAPDNVYNTARLIKSTDSSIPNANMNWSFGVEDGYKYLVRLHFCDIASISLGLLYFNVYVNGNLAIESLDLSYVSGGILAAPFYADIVVDGGSLGVINVCVAPSNMSYPNAVDALLNGIEIMKMSNLMGNFAENSPEKTGLLIWLGPNYGVSVLLVAALCSLIIASLVVRKMLIGGDGSLRWSPLPMDPSESEARAGHGNGNGVSFGKA